MRSAATKTMSDIFEERQRRYAPFAAAPLWAAARSKVYRLSLHRPLTCVERETGLEPATNSLEGYDSAN